MKKIIVLFQLLVFVVVAQVSNENTIQQLILESKYSQVITILERKIIRNNFQHKATFLSLNHLLFKLTESV